MTDTGMKGRVRGLLGGPIPAGTGPNPGSPAHLDHTDGGGHAEPIAEHQALQVLTLAQRTAEEHIADARRQAEKIGNDARANAEQVVRDAEAHAKVVQQDADKTLADARARAEQIARDAKAQADSVQRDAEELLADARARADELAKTAQESADELKHQAEQRYNDVVGGLAAKREALQRQIEALEQFDHDYRNRLTGFLQHQLRALWVDQPQVNAEELEETPPVSPAV